MVINGLKESFNIIRVIANSFINSINFISPTSPVNLISLISLTSQSSHYECNLWVYTYKE